jgi:hypothetical protein
MDGCLVQVVVPDDSYYHSVKIFSNISFENLSYSKSLFTASSFDLFTSLRVQNIHFIFEVLLF